MKNSNYTQSMRKPWITWFLWIGSFFVLNFAFLGIQKATHLTSFNDKILMESLLEAGNIIVILGINHAFTKEKIHFTDWNILNRSWMVDFFILYYVIAVIANFKMFHHAILYLIFSLLIGASEEFTFRGVILSSFIHNWRGKNPLLAGILLGSFVFGLTHMLNVYSQPLENTIVQIVVAFSLGVILSFMYLRTNNLITPIIFHALIDYCSISLSNTTTSQATWETALPLLITASLVLFFQLKPSPRRQMMHDFF